MRRTDGIPPPDSSYISAGCSYNFESGERAMTTATQLDVLDLRHFSGRQLRPLLETEARVWRERLRWNYQTSIELLIQYLDSRILPGFVALDRGRICGFTFCVYEGQKAVIGDAFAATNGTNEALAITATLLEHLFELLKNTPTISRIESQLLLCTAGETQQSFSKAGFRIYPRLFMESDVSFGALLKAGHEQTLSNDITLSSWSPEQYQNAAELIHFAYRNHVDASINDQYRSLHGSLRFLHNIIRFPGCGVFDAGASWVLRSKLTNALVGILLCSRVADDVGHITQLCIDPTHRGKGYGRLLLQHCLEQLARSDTSALTLTVTEQNNGAVELYRSLGFTIRHRFDAMVYEK